MEVSQVSGAPVGISRMPSGGGGIGRSSTSGGGRRDPNALDTLKEFAKSLYTDPYRWSIVKGVCFFGVGVFVARELAQVDFDEAIMAPPQ